MKGLKNYNPKNASKTKYCINNKKIKTLNITKNIIMNLK